MKEATLDDLDVINNFYKMSGSKLGYNSFVGTYATCLGHKENLYYEIIGDICFYIIGDPADIERVVVPLTLGAQPHKGAFAIVKYCKENDISYGTYIDSSFVDYFKSLCEIHPETESEHEVIYPVERFRTFKNIDAQKRRANIFLRNNNYTCVPFHPSLKNDVMRIVDDWEKKSIHPTNLCDNIITEFFSDFYNQLPIKGFVLYIDKKPVAFLFGEFINNKTFVLYIVKGDRAVIGVYQALYHLVCSSEDLRDIDFINGTNLTDIEGLKESKLRLKPLKIITPWELVIS